jgi:hypothetical protein
MSQGIAVIYHLLKKEWSVAKELDLEILKIAKQQFRRFNSPELLGAVHSQLFEGGMPVQETNPKRHAA